MRIAHLVLVVAGCAALTAAASAQLREGTTPAAGQTTIAPVGGDVYERFRYVALPAVTTELPITKTIMLAHVDAPAGAQWITLKSKRALKACYIPTGAKLEARSFMNGCAIDDDGDGTFDRIAGTPSQGAVQLDVKVPYKKSEYLSQNEDDVRQKLIYSGADATSIKMSYREFSGDLARPAFTQELTFPREQALPQVIRFETFGSPWKP